VGGPADDASTRGARLLTHGDRRLDRAPGPEGYGLAVGRGDLVGSGVGQGMGVVPGGGNRSAATLAMAFRFGMSEEPYWVFLERTSGCRMTAR